MRSFFKIVIGFVLSLSCVSSLLAQNKTVINSFVIQNNKMPEKAEFYSQSILAANMETYRLRDERVKLVFDNGFELELFSAKELFINGAKINPNDYQVSYSKGAVPPVFSVLASGHLAAKVSYSAKQK